MSAPTERERVIAEAREFFLKGGGGHEDGEDGARAVRYSFLGMVEMAEAFGEHVWEEALEAAAQMLEGLSNGDMPIDERMAYRVGAQAIRSLKEGV